VRRTSPGWLYLLAGLMAVALAFPPALGHTVSYRQTRRSIIRQPRAVIVVGRPRILNRTVILDGRPHGVLDINVKPKATEVWVNDVFRGTAEAFDGRPEKLWLLPGRQTIRLVTPDGIEVTREVRVKAGVEMELSLTLLRRGRR